MKRVLSALALVLVIALGLGGYFLIELYRPFEAKFTAPDHLVPQYTGPGAIPQEPGVLDAEHVVEKAPTP